MTHPDPLRPVTHEDGAEADLWAEYAVTHRAELDALPAPVQPHRGRDMVEAALAYARMGS